MRCEEISGQFEGVARDALIGAETRKPMNVRFAPEPSHLPFGILPGAKPALLDCLVERIFAIQDFDGLFIAERLQRVPVGAPAYGKQRPNFFEQAVVKHCRTALIEALVQRSPMRIQTDLQCLRSGHGITSQLLNLRSGAAAEVDDFNGADEFLMIVRVNASGGCWIVLLQKAMESRGTASGERGQAGAQRFIAKRGRGQAGEQSS